MAGKIYFGKTTGKCAYCGSDYESSRRNRDIYCSLFCRFWSKVEIKGETECWEWQNNKIYGYGLFSFNKKPKRAHRFVWEMSKGEIPSGLCVCHKCDNRACVNPDHLFLATTQENTMDKVKKDRAPKGEKNGNSKLVTVDVYEIRECFDDGVSSRELAAKYGINKSTVLDVVNRVIWRHI